MLEGTALKKEIKKLVSEYVVKYQEEQLHTLLWRAPIVGFADAYSPYIQNLKNIVIDCHKLPQDFMEFPNIVISYFIPFTEMLAVTNVNVENNVPSQEWTDAYRITNEMMGELNEYLTDQLNKMGYRAVVPTEVGMLEEAIKSNWSQRHLAYAAGIGTFGINNMLITEAGCCGRYNSIVADIPVEPDGALSEEKCLYKSSGMCKKCVQNCFSGALTVEGFDRQKCFKICKQNERIFGMDVCGKCDTNIPCAFAAPYLPEKKTSLLS